MWRVTSLYGHNECTQPHVTHRHTAIQAHANAFLYGLQWLYTEIYVCPTKMLKAGRMFGGHSVEQNVDRRARVIEQSTGTRG